MAQRIRQAAKKGCVVSVIDSAQTDWAMPVANTMLAPSDQWARALASIANAVAAENGGSAPVRVEVSDPSREIAKALLSGERKAILLGNAAAHHPNASSLLALANWIGEQTGATVGYLGEAANTVGAQFVNALPGASGLNASQMLGGSLKGVILLNNEPEFDSAAGDAGCTALAHGELVVTMSPFKANMAFSDVLLPIAPFTETPGTFVNTEGRVQSFFAAVRPLGDVRPAWKVLRVLANLLALDGFGFESSQDVLRHVLGGESSSLPADRLSNATGARIEMSGASNQPPVPASIYQLDGIVRRASSLQQTADASHGSAQDRAVA